MSLQSYKGKRSHPFFVELFAGKTWENKSKLYNLSFKSLCIFWVAFEKFGKATISFVMSVRLSVRTEQLGYRWMEFC